MAAQELARYLAPAAKERQRQSGGPHLAVSQRDVPVPPNSEEPVIEPHGEAMTYAAKAFGVGRTAAWEARRIAVVDSALAEEVKAGKTTLHRAYQQVKTDKRKSAGRTSRTEATPTSEDEHAAALRRKRSPLAVVAPPPSEDASEATKARYASLPVRILADHLGGLRLEMERQGLTISEEALAAWWEGVEARDWEQVRASVAWFDQVWEPLLKYVRYKVARRSVPPMVEAIDRANHRRQRKQA